MNHVSYTIVDLQQGTPAWLEWRSQGVGASDAPAIMGENPWKSASQLLDEKCGQETDSSSEAMTRGATLESEARKRFETAMGAQFVPACLRSTKHEWLRASVDGLAIDGSAVVEIKCGESVYRRTSASRRVPDYYFGQLQHILAVTELQSINFWCYLPNRPELHLRIRRDDHYISRLLDAEHQFWQQVAMRRTKA